MRLVVAESDALDEATVRALHRLWRDAFRGRFGVEDADHAFGGVHALLLEGHDVVAHASAVPRELLVGEEPWLTGYVEAVATLPTKQGAGLGSRVVTELGTQLQRRWALGVLSTSAHAFYRRLGWEPWHGPTFVLDEQGRRRRTEDEDDGVMVLRFGRSLGLDTTLPLTCRDRSGDAW